MELKTVKELRERFDSAKELASEEKLIAMREIRDSIHEIEKKASMDFSFDLGELSGAQSLLSSVDTAIARLESGQKRRKESSSASR